MSPNSPSTTPRRADRDDQAPSDPDEPAALPDDVRVSVTRAAPDGRSGTVIMTDLRTPTHVDTVHVPNSWDVDSDDDAQWRLPDPDDDDGDGARRRAAQRLDLDALWRDAVAATAAARDGAGDEEEVEKRAEALAVELKEYLVSKRMSAVPDTQGRGAATAAPASAASRSAGEALLYQYERTDHRLRAKVDAMLDAELNSVLHNFPVKWIGDVRQHPAHARILRYLAFELVPALLGVVLQTREALDDIAEQTSADSLYALSATTTKVLLDLIAHGKPREMFTLVHEFMERVRGAVGENMRPWMGYELLRSYEEILPRVSGKRSVFVAEAFEQMEKLWLDADDGLNTGSGTFVSALLSLYTTLVSAWQAPEDASRSEDDQLELQRILRRRGLEMLGLVYREAKLAEDTPLHLPKQEQEHASLLAVMLGELGLGNGAEVLCFSNFVGSGKLWSADDQAKLDELATKIGPLKPLGKVTTWPRHGAPLLFYALGDERLTNCSLPKPLLFSLVAPGCIELLHRRNGRECLIGLELTELAITWLDEGSLVGPSATMDGPYRTDPWGRPCSLSSLMAGLADVAAECPVRKVRERGYRAIQKVVRLADARGGVRVELVSRLLRNTTHLRLAALLLTGVKDWLVERRKEMSREEFDVVLDDQLASILPRWLEPRVTLIPELETVTAAANVARFFALQIRKEEEEAGECGRGGDDGRRSVIAARKALILREAKAGREGVAAIMQVSSHDEAKASDDYTTSPEELKKFASAALGEGRFALNALDETLAILQNAK